MSEKRELTCINCPIGCRITVELEGGEVIRLSGNTCKRGETYARAECIAPRRMVTGLVRVAERREPLCVKTSSAIAKELVMPCAELLQKTVVSVPVKTGDIVIENIFGSGVDIVATKDMA